MPELVLLKAEFTGSGRLTTFTCPRGLGQFCSPGQFG